MTQHNRTYRETHESRLNSKSKTLARRTARRLKARGVR